MSHTIAVPASAGRGKQTEARLPKTLQQALRPPSATNKSISTYRLIEVLPGTTLRVVADEVVLAAWCASGLGGQSGIRTCRKKNAFVERDLSLRPTRLKSTNVTMLRVNH